MAKWTAGHADERVLRVGGRPHISYSLTVN